MIHDCVVTKQKSCGRDGPRIHQSASGSERSIAAAYPKVCIRQEQSLPPESLSDRIADKPDRCARGVVGRPYHCKTAISSLQCSSISRKRSFEHASIGQIRTGRSPRGSLTSQMRTKETFHTDAWVSLAPLTDHSSSLCIATSWSLKFEKRVFPSTPTKPARR
jgi:hypothetical protein